ncbi:hypothetical protein CAPTEDRAFT_221267 [Capitella teleta]|uniref:Nuclear respiratory factor 1 NLS/DNA-binding dimerisation domain-containing protein n=1 Tax=Capitella teleta TaxID=283909 RepID=R7V040_CAPTE|nr:hypothetical protein CAPTEDRAFT_221267 [Capitella teleta]|eukprot:ELU11897.1 hypothetical protein CAPTEDRAFT_221267 [Capitella teleta]
MSIVHGLHSSEMNSALNATINSGIMSDAMSEPSSPESTTFDDTDLLSSSVHDDVTAQLASAGPIGVAAAAAIATGKKRKRPHAFETNPSIRKRQQTRLLRKLRATIDEYTTRVGQQAIVLTCTPGKAQPLHAFRVFGSQPLENVIRSSRNIVMGELEASLAQQAPPPQADNPALHELPPLNIDGIPTPIDKMTQAQLRAFIPEMLKYSTGRSKPGWGKLECRPVWWPDDVPWANVRSDVRTEDQKKKVSWTHALRTIVRNCYKHHGREDLIPEFADDHPPPGTGVGHFGGQTMVQTINNPDGTVSIIQIDTMDQNNPQMVTLADGTQAQVVHTLPSGMQAQDQHAVHTLADVASQHQQDGLTLSDISSQDQNQQVATLAEATINHDGQIVLTGDGGLAGMVTIPVSMYQTVVANLSQLGDQQHQIPASLLQAVSSGNIQVVNAGNGNPGLQQLDVDSEHNGFGDSDLHDPGQSPVSSSLHIEVKPDPSMDEDEDDEDVPDATQAVEIMTVENS